MDVKSFKFTEFDFSAIYSYPIKCKSIKSADLKDERILSYYKKRGYIWIRRKKLILDDILRLPTVGCIIELMTQHRPGTVHIDSHEASMIINKICYF
jgi:hypothetical protein